MTTLSGSYFKLLTPGNPKTVKGEKKGYMTFILHLAPVKLSGYQVCPMATAGCSLACLNLAGRGGIIAKGDVTNAIQRKRIWRTKRFFEAREAFMAELVADIEKAIAYSYKHDLIPVFRLNGTSDIRWESIPANAQRNVMTVFPDVQFYDYTKIANRKNVPANYHLTFSLADGNHAEAEKAYHNGMNVAVVFRDAATVARYVENSFRFGYGTIAPVHVGDDSDLRFLDPRGVCALYAKGPAKRDTSGFVVD